jgi:hypothetical protein
MATPGVTVELVMETLPNVKPDMKEDILTGHTTGLKEPSFDSADIHANKTLLDVEDQNIKDSFNISTNQQTMQQPSLSEDKVALASRAKLNSSHVAGRCLQPKWPLFREYNRSNVVKNTLVCPVKQNQESTPYQTPYSCEYHKSLKRCPLVLPLSADEASNDSSSDGVKSAGRLTEKKHNLDPYVQVLGRLV